MRLKSRTLMEYRLDNMMNVRSISIYEWIALAGEGAAPPVTIPLEGSSMQPFIRRSVDPVTIVPLQRPVKKGDVVLFTTAPNRFVVHRIWKLEKDQVQTLGDNCINPDPWLPYSSILGQVVSFRRNGRRYRLDTRAARILGRIWMALYPIRKLYLKFRSFAGRCYRKFLKKQ